MDKIEDRLNDHLKDFVDKNQPVEKRLMAARGLIPLPPSDLASILIVFVNDENEEIRKEAENSLNEIPQEQMINILSDNSTFPELLDYAAKNLEKEKYSQTILLNRNTWDGTFAFLAENDTSLANLEIIANNKQRILRSVGIVEALSKNSHLSRSIMDEVLSFLCLHLEKSDEVKKFVADKGLVDPDSGTENNEPEDLSMEEFENSFFNEVEVSDELVEETDDDYEYEDYDQETPRETIYNKIQRLNMAEKIKVALQGNRESRRYLIKDANKIISSAVLKNPKISESEIVLITQSKLVSDDILRQISDNKKWTKLYQVKLSLVKNPKTPPHISMNYLRHLREVDIKSIMRDKNLPGVISNGAKNIYKEINCSK